MTVASAASISRKVNGLVTTTTSLGRSAIDNINRRQFPADPRDPPIHREAPPLPADRQKLLDLIVASGNDGITGAELRDLLGWTDSKTHDQINKLARAELPAEDGKEKVLAQELAQAKATYTVKRQEAEARQAALAADLTESRATASEVALARR